MHLQVAPQGTGGHCVPTGQIPLPTGQMPLPTGVVPFRRHRSPMTDRSVGGGAPHTARATTRGSGLGGAGWDTGQR